MKRITLLLLLVCCIGLQGYATKIKVACVGNSITAGAAASDRATKGYVGVLTQMMGEEYDVRNFGVSGATCCRNTHKPYDQLDAFTKAKEF